MAEGPNELIRTARAALVTDVGHVFEDLAPALAWSERDARQERAQRCTAQEVAVLRALDDVGLSLDQVVHSTGMPAGRVAVVLSHLEVRGLAARVPGGYGLSTAGARTMLDSEAVVR
jgi:predicted Rossmann fold nucleotide-binding protein DprA/Smf involved in DNA uptake